MEGRGGILAKEWTFPDGKRRRIPRATLFRKLKDHRELGFKALKKVDRSDKGASRAIRPAVFQKAIELRLEQKNSTSGQRPRRPTPTKCGAAWRAMSERWPTY